MLPIDSNARKECPVTSGVLDYFPDAIVEVARVSFVGNKQHNPGQPMHWDRKKSPDHADCITRHLLERDTFDNDGLRHTAKMAWRALALLQIEIEDDKKLQEQIDNGEVCVTLKRHGTVRQKEKDVYPWIPERERALNDLLATGCPPIIAVQIIGGTTCPFDSNWVYPAGTEPRVPMVYIAGPMRGLKDFNTPAFDAARDRFHESGWVVISPADIDRTAGDSNDTEEEVNKPEAQRKYAYRDFHALHWLKAEEGDAIAMLPGWEKSVGATAEIFMARWLGLKILDTTTGGPLQYLTASYMFGANGSVSPSKHPSIVT